MSFLDRVINRRCRPAPRHGLPARSVARRHGLRWAAVLIAVLAVGGTQLTGAVRGSVATAVAQPLMKVGAGRWIAGHTDFVGYYRAWVGGKWVKVYCVSPNKRAPSRISLTTVARLSSVSATVTRELAQTLTAHGDAKTSLQAQAVSQALNYEIGNRAAAARRARYLSRAVQSLALRYVAEARRSRGGYVLRLHVSTAALPGQSGRASLSLRGAGGGRAGTVRLGHSGNVSMPASVRTDGRGHGTFGYRTTRGGEVRMTAAVSGLAPVTLRATKLSSATQRMLSWSPATSVRATAHYRGRVGGFTERYECSSTCDGHPLATLTACAPGGTYPSAITYRYRSTSHRMDFPASGGRSCRAWRTTLHDGDHVTASWRFGTPSGWTAPIPAAGSFTVDCPPAPPVAVTVAYDCRTATLTAVLGGQAGGDLQPLHNATTHRMVLVLTGARTGRFLLAPGATAAPHSFGLDCGTAAAVIVRAGIQRRSGAYNYGSTTRVVLP